jgi:ABC-type nitrate/sulfonate/bicarbonate transport system substrate-binding protein
VTVADVVSPSYFVATAAVELGFFKAEGLDAEFVFPPPDRPAALQDGRIDFQGTSAYSGPVAFPEWKTGKLLCALSHYAYWFLAVRADLHVKQGDIAAIKGLRVSATRQPSLLLKRLLLDAGIDFERDNVRIVPPPEDHDPVGNLARIGSQAIEQGIADAFWGNSMRVEYARRQGTATVLVDVRRGDGPPAARYYTFPAFMAPNRVIEQYPDACEAAIRAIVKTQQALRAEPTLAKKVGDKLFPPEEAELISTLIARDAEFYEATITPEAVVGMNRFAYDLGLTPQPEYAFDQVVATQFSHLWKG